MSDSLETNEDSTEINNSEQGKCAEEYVEIKIGRAERSMIVMALAAFSVLLASEIIFYFAFAKPLVTYKYFHYISYLLVSSIFIGTSMWHAKHYKHTFNCSLGMMFGMTIGMMSGFMIGTIIGATNGMFTGSVVGMLTGMGIGALSTRTCGIMPLLESLMAGLMAGLMGAMTAVMMINENILIFMPLLIGSCALILGGMSVMVRRESAEYVEKIAKPDIYDMFIYISAMFIFTMLMTVIILFGPRSLLVAGI